jgi:hypothetical protein
MNVHDFLNLLRTAQGETAERILDVLKTLSHDADFVRYSHAKYLPAAKQYREYIQGKHDGSVSLAEARRLRGRLGGVSRWMYAKQRRTFEDVLKLWMPGLAHAAVPDAVHDRLWRELLNMERRLLSQSRAKGASSGAARR